MMRRVLYALAPIAALSVWLYGPRIVLTLVVSLGVGVLVEYLFEKKKGGKVSEAVLVTGTLYAMSMPPAAPLWIVALGMAFAVFMAKEVYGGFGRNVFNPAIAGRLFVYISFAGVLGGSFYEPGGFGAAAGSLFGRPDALSAATPLAMMRSGGDVSTIGLILGARSGSIGESSALLIAIAAVYLVATKTAQWRLILSTLIGGATVAAGLFFAGVAKALPMESLLAGSFLFVAVFMATDPVSAPKKKPAQLAYGFMIGAVVIVVRTFSLFPEGTSFALLLGNTFASLFDKIANDAAKRKTAKADMVGAAAAGEASK
ncbi:MAG: NADH:ubiquinone oxidoreductase, Na translocating, B subunit [Spirochaetae bacterium HGW-Spirochaetae-3]|jgi:Na+-transporting NADH:ubiquinone oxidoreductase subunit B|nr:MAG: NADH:ubiquinone oxidoreductase, Na translocating, B subunit [Spirochaetae bacterium HGW-Spirochaetae-3]